MKQLAATISLMLVGLACVHVLIGNDIYVHRPSTLIKPFRNKASQPDRVPDKSSRLSFLSLRPNRPENVSVSVLVAGDVATSFPVEVPATRQGVTESFGTTERFNVSDLVLEFDFDPDRDVLMFMQIQKTGSTELDLHLVYDAEVGPPGKPGVKCICLGVVGHGQCECRAGVDGRNIWLFSAQSMRWDFCGHHRDWTEMHDCGESALDKREGKKRDRRYVKR